MPRTKSKTIKLPVVKGPTTDLEHAFAFQVRATGLPEPTWQYRFWPGHRHAFDCAWVDRKVSLELEGGITPYRDKTTRQLRQGRHSTILGYEADCIKYSEAAILGWVVLRVTRRMVDDGRALQLLERALLAVPAAHERQQAA